MLPAALAMGDDRSELVTARTDVGAKEGVQAWLTHQLCFQKKKPGIIRAWGGLHVPGNACLDTCLAAWACLAQLLPALGVLARTS